MSDGRDAAKAGSGEASRALRPPRRIARAWSRVALVVTLVTPSAWAAVPSDIGYQGRLLDTGGRALAGPVDLEVRIFDLPSAGSLLYTETHASMPLVDGVFQILVGTGSAQTPPGGLPDAVTGGVNRWLELVVDEEALAPRQPFSSAAFALAAQSADALAGTKLEGLVRKGEASSISAPMLATGSVTTASLASGSVITASLANGAVTAAKVRGGPGSGLDADTVDGIHGTVLMARINVLETQLAASQAQIAALQALLAGVSRNGSTLQFSGMNVQVVSGSGQTYGAVNGLGNLIVGYNELRGSGDQRAGSHNVIVGAYQNYTAYGGLVAGYNNAVTFPYASVSGGYGNVAGNYYASVSGGASNTANGRGASVSGGYANSASSYNDSVSGGYNNIASGSQSSVSGGSGNRAYAPYASVSGGADRYAQGPYDWLAGALLQDY